MFYAWSTWEKKFCFFFLKELHEESINGEENGHKFLGSKNLAASKFIFFVKRVDCDDFGDFQLYLKNKRTDFEFFFFKWKAISGLSEYKTNLKKWSDTISPKTSIWSKMGSNLTQIGTNISLLAENTWNGIRNGVGIYLGIYKLLKISIRPSSHCNFVQNNKMPSSHKSMCWFWIFSTVSQERTNGFWNFVLQMKGHHWFV